MLSNVTETNGENEILMVFHFKDYYCLLVLFNSAMAYQSKRTTAHIFETKEMKKIKYKHCIVSERSFSGVYLNID